MKRRNAFKLKEERFRLNKKEEVVWFFVCFFFSPIRVVGHWNKLPREVVDALSLKTLKGKAGQGSEEPD